MPRAMIVPILGSDGNVMAEFGNLGYLLEGKRRPIQVIAVGPDEETSLSIRQGLVGTKVITTFTAAEVGLEVIPTGSILAYVDDVVAGLLEAGKEDIAAELQDRYASPLTMYVFEPGTYRLLANDLH